jgi:hypothetical protein
MQPFYQLVANGAVRNAPSNAKSMGAMEEEMTPEEAKERAEQMVTQDPAWRSWRLWGAFWAMLTGLLSIPEVQLFIHANISAMIPTDYVPLFTAALATLWPVVSKARDTRPESAHG